METDTKYAYDPIDKVPVFIGNREDWTERKNKRWYGPTRDDPEIAEHQSWGRTYWCCDDPECASPVVAAQGPEKAWHFRRKRASGKPPHCVNCERFSGESSFHWKTALNIEKMLQRLHRQGKQWLGKDIAFVQREKTRLFPIGEQNVSLRPDVFVMFADGDWLAIEIVYTHRPEMHHHEAYKPLANGDTTFGPRVVVVDLNDELPEINEETHRLWAREGGIEDVLAREASEAKRMARFEERLSHFNSRLAADILKAKNRFMSQVEREFPDFVWAQQPAIDATPAEAEQAFVAQRREQLKRDALQRHFDGLVDAHQGRTYGLDPSDFNSTEAIEQAFEACLKEMNRRHQGIMDLNEQFIFLDVPRTFMDERQEEFDEWFSKMQASASKCQAALEEARLNALEAGCDEDDVDVLNGFIFDHETKDVNEYKKRLEAELEELLWQIQAAEVKKAVEAFNETTGILVTKVHGGFTIDELVDEVGLDTLPLWLEEVRAYVDEVNTFANSAAIDWDLSEEMQSRMKTKLSYGMDFADADDRAGIPAFVSSVINDTVFHDLKTKIRSEFGFSIPREIWEHVGQDAPALRLWSSKLNEFRDRCEHQRQRMMEKAKRMDKGGRCVQQLENHPIPYDLNLDVERFVVALQQIFDRHKGIEQGRQTGRRRRSERVKAMKAGTSPSQPTSTTGSPTINTIKSEIKKLKKQQTKQLDIERDRLALKRVQRQAYNRRQQLGRQIRRMEKQLRNMEEKQARNAEIRAARSGLQAKQNAALAFLAENPISGIRAGPRQTKPATIQPAATEPRVEPNTTTTERSSRERRADRMAELRQKVADVNGSQNSSEGGLDDASTA